MSPRYFQGTSVKGDVRASVARTFSDVVDAFRICPPLGLTRAAFLALPKKERNEIKHVPFFVAACFKDSPSKRLYEKATICNLIFIDIDETKEGRCPAAPFVSNPESLYTALAGFNFAAHHTASSTANRPRIRICIDADAIPLCDYPRAVRTIAKLLGLSELTSESKVAVQPMFRPTLFSDSTDQDNPLIAYELDGRAFTVADISDTLPDEYTREFQQPELPGVDALGFLRAPVPEITLAIANEALSTIDPDCSYFDWLEIAAALRHQFSPHKAEEAYELFDVWSSEGSKYAGEEETRAKWDSLRPTPIGRVPVTIRSLLRQAVAAGWDDKRVKENCFQKLLEWMEQVPNATELLEKGVQKILAAPLMSAVQEDMLVDQLRAHAKKRFAITVQASAIRKDLARTKAEIKNSEKTSEKGKEHPFVKGVYYVSAPNEFCRHRTGERYKSESFNSSYARHLLPTEDSLKEAGLPVTPANLSKPIITPTDYALNQVKVVTAYDYAYDPSQSTEMYFVNHGRKYINTYSPTYPELDIKQAQNAGELFERHLVNLVAEGDYRKTLVEFMAFLVQFPGKKIRWAVLIQSVEGGGKTFLAEAMKAVLGREHVKTIDGGAIKGGWNEWAFGAQLVALEEVRVAGTNKHEIMNALKPLITNDQISLNEKFRNNREVANITNYMMFSNHHDALALTPGDRRYFVIKSPLQRKSQVQALGENYFPPLFAMLRDRPGALRAYLMDYEISPSFRPDGHAPRTKYVQDLINDSADNVTAAVRRMLLEGDFPLIQYDIVSAKSMIDALQMEEGITRVSSQQVAQILREEGLHQIGRHMISGERHYLWVRSGVDQHSAVDVAADRVRRGLKNLGIEILF